VMTAASIARNSHFPIGNSYRVRFCFHYTNGLLKNEEIFVSFLYNFSTMCICNRHLCYNWVFPQANPGRPEMHSLG
jgi:hypothetical protein